MNWVTYLRGIYTVYNGEKNKINKIIFLQVGSSFNWQQGFGGLEMQSFWKSTSVSKGKLLESDIKKTFPQLYFILFFLPFLAEYDLHAQFQQPDQFTLDQLTIWKASHTTSLTYFERLDLKLSRMDSYI